MCLAKLQESNKELMNQNNTCMYGMPSKYNFGGSNKGINTLSK